MLVISLCIGALVFVLSMGLGRQRTVEKDILAERIADLRQYLDESR